MGVVAALGAIGLFFALASDLLVFSLNDSITTLSLLIVTLLLQVPPTPRLAAAGPHLSALSAC